MSGLTQAQVDKIIQTYYEQRQARPGPRLTAGQTLDDLRQLTTGPGPADGETTEDFVKRFIKRVNKQRDSLPNALLKQDKR